jgi:putative selenium metabolism hydrolase
MEWDNLLADCVDFTQRLVRTPSMPHEEALVAELIAAEMQQLNFDQVWLDKIGNVYGRVYGRDRSLGALALNSHTDHVDPGDLSLWPVPPYSAQIIDGRILGRATCDIKGPLAVQVYSLAALLRHGERPRRDVVFCGVVQEELGGAGAVYWVDHLDYPVDLVVLGEPSDNNLALGHRGILQMWLTFHGRSVHASVPAKGENPNYALATFLKRLQESQSELSSHPLLGRTSIAPTIIEVDTKSGNVTPAWTRVLLDCRTASESSNSLQAFVHRLAGAWPHTIADSWSAEPNRPLSDSDETIFGYYTPPESEAVQRVRAAVSQGMGREPALTSYQFATDGRFFSHWPVIGYSPAEEHLAHTVKESISIAKMAESLRGHVQLLRDF